MRNFVITTSLAAIALVSTPVWADADLAKKKNCMACHKSDVKLVGPAYKDVSKKYAGDKAAVDKLTTKVQKGGSGVWGKVPMPPNPLVNKDEAKKLVQWILDGAK